MKELSITSLVIIILSLGVWLFFFNRGMPLSAAGTMVVVGAWTGVAIVFRSLWRHWRKRRDANE